MADKNIKSDGNVDGKYYVDQNCINCGLCAGTAPEFFALNDDSYMAYVQKQPQTADEIDTCENALSGCPVGSIGNDGEE